MIKDLETAISYRFRNIQLLQNALTHSSYANERWHNSLLSNERLEFLGDSVLGMLVADYLYRTFPNRPEGELTRMRADMVCEKTLAAAANRIGLGNHLLLGHGEERFGGRSRDSILADAMESVIAACFLDGGLEAALKVVQQFILVEVPVTKLHNADYKITTAKNLTATGIQHGAIPSAFADAEPGDVSMFYYSGHGTEAGALVGVNNTYLTVYGLRTALQKIPGTKIVILDCCYSGQAINKSGGTQEVDLNAFNRAMIGGLTAQPRSSENLADGGFIVLTACRKDQQSVSLTGDGSIYWGVFTYGLCYGSGYDEWTGKSLGYLPADSNGSGSISLGEAWQGVRERVNYLNTLYYLEQAVQYHGDTSFVLWKK